MSTIAAFLVGAGVGMVVLARWYIWRLSKPEVAREALKSLYRQAHPHWLQRSEDDTRAVCPCCGWAAQAVGPVGPVGPKEVA